MAEAYKYALVPRQDDPGGSIEFDIVGLDSDGPVAERVSRKMLNDGALATQFPPVLLRQRLNGVLQSRWADGHVPVSTLWEDFARYVYLPRLRDQDVMLKTVEKRPSRIRVDQRRVRRCGRGGRVHRALPGPSQ